MSIEQAIEGVIEQCKANIPVNEEDYTDSEGFLVCGKCNTRKQTEVEILGKKRRPMCLCKCQTEQRDRDEAEYRQRQQRNRVLELQKRGFSKEEREKMLQWTFENDNGKNPQLKKALEEYVKNFSTFKEQGKGLLLHGDCSTGKTFAACQIANALMQRGIPVLVTNFARITNHLLATFEKQEYIDDMNSFPLLVIDDLGIERDTKFVMEQMYNVIDSRYRAGLPMIITTNLSIDAFKKPETIDEKRIFERLLERCFPIEVKGHNYRRQAIRESYSEMKEILGL